MKTNLKKISGYLFAILLLVDGPEKSSAAVFDRVIDLDAGLVVGDDFWVPFPDTIFNIGEMHTFNLTFQDDKRLRVQLNEPDDHFQVALHTFDPTTPVVIVGGPLSAPYIGRFVMYLKLGEDVVGLGPPPADPTFVPPGRPWIPVTRDFDAYADLMPPGETVEFDSISIDWLPLFTPHPNSANANFLTVSTLGGAVSIVEGGPPPPTFETLYWSGATGTSQYATAGNWADSETSTPSALAPVAGTALLLDDRLNGGPPADTFTYIPIELDGSLTNEAASITVAAARYELVKKSSSTTATLQLGGPVNIYGDSFDYSIGLSIGDKTTLDLTPGGASGDISVSVATNLGNIGLLVHGGLIADEINLNVPVDAHGQRSLLVTPDNDVVGSNASVEARILNIEHSTASATLFSSSVANITEKTIVGGELALFAGAVVNTPLVDVKSTGRLAGGGFGFGAPGQLNADVLNAGTLAPGRSSFFAGGTAGPYLINGDYEQTVTGEFEVHLDGATPDHFDNVTISGNATLAGTLVASVASGSSFLPTEFDLERGMEFLIMSITGDRTGMFEAMPQNSFVFNDPTSGLDVFIDYFAGNGNDVRLFTLPLLGDYDGNGTVNAADQDEWKSTFGNAVSPSGSGADGNGNGIVDAADYVVWRKQIGTGTTLSVSEAAIAPEPATPMLLMFAMAGWFLRRGRDAQKAPKTHCP